MSKLNELYWAAGFFDGEGSCCMIYPTGREALKRFPRLVLSLGQSGHREELDRFNFATGNLGKVYGPYKHQGNKPIYHLRINNQDAELVAGIILPFVCRAKNRQINLALKRWRKRKIEFPLIDYHGTRKRNADGTFAVVRLS